MQDLSDLGAALKQGLLSLTAAATVALPFLGLPAEVIKFLQHVKKQVRQIERWLAAGM